MLHAHTYFALSPRNGERTANKPVRAQVAG